MIRFITYNNLPFNKIQAMCNFLKDNINDENDIKLFKSVQLSRCKLTSALNKFIKPVIKENLEEN